MKAVEEKEEEKEKEGKEESLMLGPRIKTQEIKAFALSDLKFNLSRIVGFHSSSKLYNNQIQVKHPGIFYFIKIKHNVQF